MTVTRTSPIRLLKSRHPATMSTRGRAWLIHSEGCDLIAYEDPPGSGTYSVGYGHHGVPQGTVWTEAQAEAALDANIQRACDIVHQHVMVDLTQGQFDALVDFVYNVKLTTFLKSTLLRDLNFGQYSAIPTQLARFVYAGKVVSVGLKARRAGEAILWNGGDPLAPEAA